MIDPRYPQRKSPRLQGYDYSQAGAYFVTICTYQRLPLFGEVCNAEMHLNDLGEIAAACWVALPGHFPQVEQDAWVIMPNHMHGIILLGADEGMPHGRAVARPYSASAPRTLGAIVNAYKGAVTRQARRIPGDESTRIWQGRYHDHIIRSERSLLALREYVLANPARWREDTFFTA